MPRAGWNSLPRPARSESNPEVKAGLPRMALPFVGCREASSSLAYFAAQSAKTKETPSDRMVFLFGMPRAGWNSLPRPARSASNPEVKAGLPRMALPFVGCREASSSLAYFAAQSAKTKETPSDRMVFLFGMPRAGLNSLPQPARSASNPEVKAGLLRMALPFVGCREASSSLVYFAAQSAKTKEKPPFGRCFSDCRNSLSLRASARTGVAIRFQTV